MIKKIALYAFILLVTLNIAIAWNQISECENYFSAANAELATDFCGCMSNEINVNGLTTIEAEDICLNNPFYGSIQCFGDEAYRVQGSSGCGSGEVCNADLICETWQKASDCLTTFSDPSSQTSIDFCNCMWEEIIVNGPTLLTVAESTCLSQQAIQCYGDMTYTGGDCPDDYTCGDDFECIYDWDMQTECLDTFSDPTLQTVTNFCSCIDNQIIMGDNLETAENACFLPGTIECYGDLTTVSGCEQIESCNADFECEEDIPCECSGESYVYDLFSLYDYPSPIVSEGVNGILELNEDITLVIADNAFIENNMALAQIGTYWRDLTGDIATSGLESYIVDPTAQNLFLIGSCEQGDDENGLITSLFGVDCANWAYTDGQAVISFIEIENNKIAMAIIGTKAVDTQLASHVLTNPDNYQLCGTSVLVSGPNINSLVVETLDVTCLPPECSDATDNDGDGLIDLNDPSCIDSDDPSESETITYTELLALYQADGTECMDGLDNDGDGLIDMDDTECISPIDNDEDWNAECMDGIDNNYNGIIDFGGEGNLICRDPNDNNEAMFHIPMQAAEFTGEKGFWDYFIDYLTPWN